MIWYRNRFEVLRHAAAITPLDGMILEFGVATGETIRCLAESKPLRNRRIYGFDSFEGLPEAWGGYQAGHFACDVPKVPDNVELVIGKFEETLAPFLVEHRSPVALIHIDCDLYTSTKFILEGLNERIVPGTVIEMDEYWIVVKQERRAFEEWASSYRRVYQHEARSTEQLCVVIET